MAKKRGRPPKTPVTNAKEGNCVSPGRGEVAHMDLAALEDADLDNLTPKEAEQILECIDALRSRIKGKEKGEGTLDQGSHSIDDNVKINAENEELIGTVKDTFNVTETPKRISIQFDRGKE
ncbi:hypothetical protein RIF29_28669 [Crotalaria pallida]|uniref:Uncharacterized protein n=1 Tax=Crotalaria pallida TaxID=3830 RepID=A0AAN9HV83_CROPI